MKEIGKKGMAIPVNVIPEEELLIDGEPGPVDLREQSHEALAFKL